MLELLGFPVPFFVATFLGMRAGARDPQSVAEFCNETVIALAWAVAVNFSMALLVDYVANARSMAEYDNLGWALDT